MNVTTFKTLAGAPCTEVQDPHTLNVVAYCELTPSGAYLIDAMNPITGTRRTANRKTLAGAQAVLDRHLTSLGYPPATLSPLTH